MTREETLVIRLKAEFPEFDFEFKTPPGWTDQILVLWVLTKYHRFPMYTGVQLSHDAVTPPDAEIWAAVQRTIHSWNEDKDSL